MDGINIPTVDNLYALSELLRVPIDAIVRDNRALIIPDIIVKPLDSNVEPYKEGCKHINLAANVCGYTPINLGKIIKEGVLADIPSIHRMAIDRQVKRGSANDINGTKVM